MNLPERKFEHPVARAIIDQRKELATDPGSRLAVADTLSEKVPALAGVIASPFRTPAAICDAEKLMLPPATTNVS